MNSAVARAHNFSYAVVGTGIAICVPDLAPMSIDGRTTAGASLPLLFIEVPPAFAFGVECKEEVAADFAVATVSGLLGEEGTTMALDGSWTLASSNCCGCCLEGSIGFMFSGGLTCSAILSGCEMIVGETAGLEGGGGGGADGGVLLAALPVLMYEMELL